MRYTQTYAKKGNEVLKLDHLGVLSGGDESVGAATTKTPAEPFSVGQLRKEGKQIQPKSRVGGD
jgi:hypothetical protein